LIRVTIPIVGLNSDHSFKLSLERKPHCVAKIKNTLPAFCGILDDFFGVAPAARFLAVRLCLGGKEHPASTVAGQSHKRGCLEADSHFPE
jgi:hypothetical protein